MKDNIKSIICLTIVGLICSFLLFLVYSLTGGKI